MTKAELFSNAQNKLAAYDQETEYLMEDAAEFDDVYNEHFQLSQIVKLLRNSFKEGITRSDVFGKYDYIMFRDEAEYDANGRKRKKDPARGYCMVSSYLIYSMTGGDAVWELHGTPSHWWLYHKKTHTRFDITHTQFDAPELNAHYFHGKNVKYLNTDQVFWNKLRTQAAVLAERAGLK